MSSQKVLYMLIGPKGSGKTHIGTLVNRYTDIVFLRVEPVWLDLKTGEDGWKKVEAVIDSMFQTHNKVMIESLGIGEGFSHRRKITFGIRSMLAKQVRHEQVYRRTASHESNQEEPNSSMPMSYL